MKDVYDQYLYDGTAQKLKEFFEKSFEERVEFIVSGSNAFEALSLLNDLHTAYRKMSHDYDKCLTALVAHLHQDAVIEKFTEELAMVSIHPEPHPLAGRYLKLEKNAPEIYKKFGDMIRVEDWYDRVAGEMWPASRARGVVVAEDYARHAAELNVQRGSQDVVLCHDLKGERILLHHDWVKGGEVIG
jgi:hypothetical protein